jgi:hypothetical protein
VAPRRNGWESSLLAGVPFPGRAELHGASSGRAEALNAQLYPSTAGRHHAPMLRTIAFSLRYLAFPARDASL